jgi:hypothetical protein
MSKWAIIFLLASIGFNTNADINYQTHQQLFTLLHQQHFKNSNDINTLVKHIDVAKIMELIHGQSDYLDAASNVFIHVLKPYYATKDPSVKTNILNRLRFSCQINDTSPAGFPGALAFPFQVSNNVSWVQYLCHFIIQDGSYNYVSPDYHINQLRVTYQANTIAPGVAFENYQTGSASLPINHQYQWLGKYVQPLNVLLRDKQGNIPTNVIAGVNGGYDYRVDLWENYVPQDNICLPRYNYLAKILGKMVADPNEFYSAHPAKRCKMDSNNLPTCINKDGSLPITDDLGDSLILLPKNIQQRSWQTSIFQSYNCGGAAEQAARGSMAFYGNTIQVRRTTPSKNDINALLYNGELPSSAIGAGPLLIDNNYFVYDSPISEEGMGLDNYEIGGATGVGYTNNSAAGTTVYLVNINGDDNKQGMHDWLLGLYFTNYLHANGAIALGNGGDATLWINPNTPSVQKVLADSSNANYAFFTALFKNNNNPGVVSNCQFSTGSNYSAGCNARPVHDGLFVWQK